MFFPLFLYIQNFLNGLVHLPFMDLSNINFGGFKDENLVNQQDRAWPEGMDMLAGKALHWSQRLITFDG
jgi:hypothetical protein